MERNILKSKFKANKVFVGFPDSLSTYGETQSDSCDDIPSSALVCLHHTRGLHFQLLPTYREYGIQCTRLVLAN